MGPSQVGGTAVGEAEQHAEQPAAGRQLAVTGALGQQRLDGRRHPRGIDQLLQPPEVGFQGRRPPRRATASSSLALAARPRCRPGAGSS